MAQPSRIPHENPDAAEDSIYPPAYLLFCSDAIDLLVSGDAEGIDKLFTELDKANVPSELLDILKTYRGMLAQLSTDLDRLEDVLNKAEERLKANRLTETKALLDEAKTLMANIEKLIEDVEKATATLYSRLARLTSIPAVADKLKEALATVDKAIEKLWQLQEKYKRLLWQLDVEFNRKQLELEPTELTLSLGKTEAFVGESIDVSGVLLSKGVGISTREVAILVDGQKVATARTQSDGRYTTKLPVPYRYVPEMSVLADYVPADVDKIAYFGCSSPAVKLTVRYYESALTVDVEPGESFVGESVRVSGKLTSPGNTIPPNRQVDLLLDDAVAGSARTASDGSYVAQISVPFKYVPLMKLQARYIPKGEPGDIYKDSQSRTVDLQVLFYRTSVEINAPGEALPGLPFVLSGKISSQGPASPERGVTVKLGDQQVARTTASGTFQITVTPDAKTTEGVAVLSVIVDPNGRHSGAAGQSTLSIVKRTPTIDVSASHITIWPASVNINGKVWTQDLGPVSGAAVKVSLRDVSAETKTLVDGTFEVSIGLPPGVRQAQSEEVLVEVLPDQPWLAPSHETAKAFVANPLLIGLAATALVSAGAVIYKGRRGLIREIEAPAETSLLSLPAQMLTETTTVTATGILGAYIRALRCIEETTGAVLKPEMTLRDLLDLLTTHPDMGDALRPFEQLTTLTEKALYSPEVLEVGEERWANLLCQIIEEELTK